MNYGDSDDSLSAADYGRFLTRFFQLWLNKGKLGLKIREFDEFLRGHYGTAQRLCAHCGVCELYFTIAPTGEVFPCDCFPQTQETRLGTVFGGIEKCYSKQKDFYCGSDELPRVCETCSYSRICNGGCKYHRWLRQANYSQPQYYCASYKTLYGSIQKSLSMQ
jgi:uncharacterized protein